MTTQMQHRPKKYSAWVILLGILAIVILMAIPLVFIKDSKFGGSDGAGSQAITTIAPAYNSEWTTNWWRPPGSETESALFALQATVGGILIGYFFGYLHGRKKGQS